jgi:RND family efflux transporter MFP subunit
LVLAGCHPAEQAAPVAAVSEPAPLQADLVTVGYRTWPQLVRCQGSLVADDSAVVGARVAGLVSETLVDVGDQVEAGTKLVSLDAREFTLQLAAAEAALLQARAAVGLQPGDPVAKLNPLNAPPVREARALLEEADSRLQRWQQLRGTNAVAEEELQALQALHKVADARYSSAINGVNSNIAQIAVRSAEVDLARQRLTDAEIVAPFAGYIQQRLVAPGTYVQIGTPLVTLVRVDTLRFRGTLPERVATQLKIGQRVQLHVQSLPEPLEIQVTRINPAIDMTSRALTFEALVDNSQGTLRAGLFAEAEVTIDPEAEALVIDQASLVEFAGTEKVWKVVGGAAQEQAIRVGRRADGLVEVLGGLAAGELILRDAAEGRVAKVVPRTPPAGRGRTMTAAITAPVTASESNPPVSSVEASSVEASSVEAAAPQSAVVPATQAATQAPVSEGVAR